MQKALAWPLQVMFMAPYDSAQLVISDQGEVLEHYIKWQDCSTPYQHNRKRYYEYKLERSARRYSLYGASGLVSIQMALLLFTILLELPRLTKKVDLLAVLCVDGHCTFSSDTAANKTVMHCRQ